MNADLFWELLTPAYGVPDFWASGDIYADFQAREDLITWQVHTKDIDDIYSSFQPRDDFTALVLTLESES